MDGDVEYTSFGIPGCEPVHKKKGFMHQLVARFIDRNTSAQVAPRLEDNPQCTDERALMNDQQLAVSCQETHTDADVCSRAMSIEKTEKFAPSSVPFSDSNLSSYGANSSVKHLPFRSSATGSGDAVTNPTINRRYWMTDESCRQCFECACRFTPIRRKHHCRVCGRIFCHQCSNKFIEGQQIGMSGLQRVCNYCAYSLPSASHTASATQPDGTQPTLKNQMTNSSVPKSTPLDCSSSDLKERKAIIDRGTTIYGTKQSFRRRDSAVTYANQRAVDQAIPINASSRSTIFPILRTSFSPNLPCSIPTFPNLLSSGGGKKLSRVSSTHLGVPSNSKVSTTSSSQQGCPCCRQQFSDSLAVNSNRSVGDYPPFPSNFDGHVYGNMNETHIRELWSRMVESYVGFRRNSDYRMPNSNRLLDVDTLELAGLSLNPKELQVITFTHQQRTVYCAYGLSLVYWLTSNVPDVQQCRNKARSVCQRFLDLSLLAPLKDSVSNEFRDDFTPYELKQLTPTVYVPSVPKTGRRLSWPMDSTYKPTNMPKFNQLGADEPDWLQEIDNLSFSHLNSSGLSASSIHVRGETTYSSTRGCGKNLRHTGKALAELSTSVDLGLKTVVPQDSPPHDFEIGEDVRANKDTFCVDTLCTDRRSCLRESAPELSNTTFIQSRPSPTRDVATKPLASSLSQHLELIHTFRSSFDAHVRQLALQEIRDNHLDVGWTDLLVELAQNVCDQVKFDLRTIGIRPLGDAHAVSDSSATTASSSTYYKRHIYSPMDIRHYVHIKKVRLECGAFSRFAGFLLSLLDNSGLSSEVFPGVVFSKRATHKFMPNLLRNPRILLLASSIEYQRTPTKLTCLESQIMQEEEYLSNCVSKLLRLHPNIIFVGGSVSYVAQMLLLKTGIILFCNVKRSVLIRLARATGADILESCDRLVSETSSKSANVQRSSAQLGTSRQFKVEQVRMSDESSKFLTFVQNSNKTPTVISSASSDQSAACKHITCEVTVLLRGPDLATLRRVERALGFMLHVCHNVKLERSYMTNGFLYRNLSPVTTTQLAAIGAVAHCRPQLSCPSSVPFAVTLPDSESRSSGSTSDLQQPPKELNHVDGSALVNYLQHRLFNPSASVQVVLPFLATADGQQAPLVAYYTYVIEWPFGRILNDLLKRKLKVIHSELYAVEQAKRQRLTCPIAILDHKCLEHRSRRHAFLTYNIQSNCPDVPQTSMISKRFSPIVRSALDRCTSVDVPPMTDSVTVSCEAIYTDFKARGPEKELANHSATRSALSRLSYGLINLMAAHSDLLLDIRTLFLNSPQQYQLQHPKSTSNKLAVSRKPVTSPENNQKIKRLERSILDPRSHQFFNFLATLFSVKSPMWPEPCVPPWIASVEFYGSQDLPLGLFLERCCFTHQPCRHPHCDCPMSDHVQRFVQSSGSVQLFIRKLPQDPPRPAVTPSLDGILSDNSGRRDSRIIMWLYCSTCRTNSPAAYLSGDTWHYSFVKFLDLLINTPADWARCAMRTPTTSISTVTEMSASQQLVGVADQVNKYTDVANSARHIATNSSTATRSGMTLPGWQLTCTHSAHKSVQHCFSLDRKVAVFKYQQTKVFEVVMPANEIRIYPSPCLAAKYRLLSTKRDYDQSLLMTDAALASDNICAAQTTINQRAVAIPSYLYAEAVETWEKQVKLSSSKSVVQWYYRSYTSIKAHLVTLQQDNVNPELDSLLKTYVYLLENDSRRKFWEVRAELLAHLINLDNRCSTALSSGMNFSGVQMLNSTPSILRPSPTAVSDVHLETKASVSNVDSFKLSSGDMNNTSNNTNDLAFGVSPRLNCVSTDEPVIMVQPPVLRVHTPVPSPEVKNSKDPSSSLVESDGNCVEYTGGWAAFLDTVDVVEKTFMVQHLVNDLKRWIYGFVSEWNTRCAEYESQLK
ncbi:hypothetical protein AHF37_04296, partial [Paragonimus kellicotti]